MMKIKKIIIFVILFPAISFTFMACGGGRTGDSEWEMEEIKQLVKSRQFEIEHRWANPLRGDGRINLIGNPNFIRFKGDSVDIFLPYFGVRQSGGGYNREGGIRYEGIARDVRIEENRDKNLFLRFKGQTNNETQEFTITIFPNRRVETYVNSMQRDAISYQGEIEPLKDEKR